jgi:ligand-binding sensor domain-containing protein
MKIRAFKLVLLLLAVSSASCTTDVVEPSAEANPAASVEANPEPSVKAAAPIQIAQYPSAPHEDQAGNLWFGTAFHGLVRYDGEKFETFTTEDGLGSNMIRGMIEIEDGTLWIATGGGLTKYDGKNFTTLTGYAAIGDPPNAVWENAKELQFELWDVMLDRKDQLWISTMAGAFRRDGTTLVPHLLPAMDLEHEFQFTSKMVYEIFEDKDGVLWFCTDGSGVIRDDGKTQTTYTTKDGLCSDFVCSMVQDPRGDYWFGTANGGVSHFDGSSFTTHFRNEEYSESMGWGRFMGVHLDSTGSVWFGAAGPVRGAYKYDGKSFEFFTKKDGLGDGHIPSISEDRKGNVWFGTSAGVYRYDGKEFVNFTRD